MSALENKPWSTVSNENLSSKYEKCLNITEEIYKRINITFQIRKLENAGQSDASELSDVLDSNLSNETDLFACDKTDSLPSSEGEGGKRDVIVGRECVNINNNVERVKGVQGKGKRPKKRFRKRAKKRQSKKASDSDGSSDEAPLSRIVDTHVTPHSPEGVMGVPGVIILTKGTDNEETQNRSAAAGQRIIDVAKADQSEEVKKTSEKKCRKAPKVQQGVGTAQTKKHVDPAIDNKQREGKDNNTQEKDDNSTAERERSLKIVIDKHELEKMLTVKVTDDSDSAIDKTSVVKVPAILEKVGEKADILEKASIERATKRGLAKKQDIEKGTVENDRGLEKVTKKALAKKPDMLEKDSVEKGGKATVERANKKAFAKTTDISGKCGVLEKAPKKAPAKKPDILEKATTEKVTEKPHEKDSLEKAVILQKDAMENVTIFEKSTEVKKAAISEKPLVESRHCPMCSLSFRGDRGLRRHMAMTHIISEEKSSYRTEREVKPA